MIDPPAEGRGAGESLEEKCGCKVIELDSISGLFCGVVFSTWDNILGPVNKLVWVSKQTSISAGFHEELLPFIPACTLNSEIMRDDVGLVEAVHKFYTLSEIEFVVSSFIFTSAVGSTGKTDLFAISLVMSVVLFFVFFGFAFAFRKLLAWALPT